MSEIVQTVPLLKGLRVEGGTLYTFSSAMNDAILLFSNNNIRLNFSKFACIKLPDWANVTTQRIFRDSGDIASINDTPGSDTANTFFPKAYFQNYMENFLAYVDAERSDPNYSNFVEAAFWKALQSVSDDDQNQGTNADNTIQLEDDVTYIDGNSQTRQKYKEIAASASYDPVIKFVGDINMMNLKKSEGKEYLEVFAHIANSQGRIDGVLLKPNDDLTTQVGLAQVPDVAGPLWISGHEDTYTNAQASEESYAKAVYDTVARQYNVTSDKDFLQIDWDDIEDPASDDKHRQGHFDFNAVLLYYDIANENDDTTRKRNLYGVLILDDMTEVSAVTDRIVAQKKYQPNENQAGNAFGFLFNLMFSNSTNNITSTVTINDTAVVAMQLYMKALGQLQNIINKYERFEQIILEQQATIVSLKAQMLGLQNRLITDETITALRNDLNTVTETASQNASDIAQNAQDISINH